MKKNYFVTEGNYATVTDEKGNLRIFENNNNKDQIFETQNVIEEIGKQIKDTESEKKQLLSQKKSNKFSLLSGFIFLPIFFNLFICLITLGTNNSAELVKTAVGYMTDQQSMYFATNFVYVTILLPIYHFATYKYNIINKLEGVNNKLELLKNELKVKEALLSKLEAEKKVVYGDKYSAKTKEISQKDVYELRNKVTLTYLFGLRKNRYYKLHKKGILIDKLKNSYGYSSEEASATEKMLVEDIEKEQTLVKAR